MNEASAPANHVFGVVNALRQLGHELTIVCPSDGGKPPLGREGIPMRRFAFYNFRGGWRLYEAQVASYLMLCRHDADVHYFRLSPSRLVARVMRRLEGTKVVEINGLDIISQPVTLAYLGGADIVTVGSHEMKRAIMEGCSGLRAEILVQSNCGVSSDQILRISRSAAREEAGLAHDAMIVLFVSTFQPYHDFDTIFRSLSAFASRCEAEKIILLLPGEGPTLNTVRERAGHCSGRVDIRFVGSLRGRALSLHIASADVCVNLLTRSKVAEGNGKAQKTVEYLAHGRPVIESVAPRLPIPEWLSAGAFLVPAQDPAAVTAMLTWLRENPAEAVRRSTAASAYVEERFQWRAVVSGLVGALEARRALAYSRGCNCTGRKRQPR
jgi:glycosyltransferase involved in cell wall biosynthesis